MEDLNYTTYYPVGTVGFFHAVRVIVYPAEVGFRLSCLRCIRNGLICPGNKCFANRRKDNTNIVFKII